MDCLTEAAKHLTRRVVILDKISASRRPSLKEIASYARLVSISADEVIAEAATRCGVGDVWDNATTRDDFIAALEERSRNAQ